MRQDTTRIGNQPPVGAVPLSQPTGKRRLVSRRRVLVTTLLRGAALEDLREVADVVFDPWTENEERKGGSYNFLEAGQVLANNTGGGGGWGNPFERDPALVAKGVLPGDGHTGGFLLVHPPSRPTGGDTLDDGGRDGTIRHLHGPAVINISSLRPTTPTRPVAVIGLPQAIRSLRTSPRRKSGSRATRPNCAWERPRRSGDG